MKKIVIIPNTTKDTDLSVTSAVISKLSAIGIESYIEKTIAVASAIPYTDFPTDAELIIVIGGDGSVIDAAKSAVTHNIPLLGVNLGRIGYLTSVEPSALQQLDRLLDGDYYVDEKLLLTVGDGTIAVNDVVVSHSDYLGVCNFTLSDSMGNAITYRADGVILSTPQGSTAYALSAGGPIIAHDVDSILVTPVCPHSFFNRSVLFNSRELLTIRNDGAQPMNVSVDGRIHSVLAEGESIKVTRAKENLKMITFSKNSMFSELFRKMSILEGLK